MSPTLEPVSPNTGRVFCSTPVTSNAEVAAACDALAVASAELHADTRRAVLTEVEAAIRVNRALLSQAIVLEVGKTRGEADGEVDYAAEFFAAAARALPMQATSTESAPGRRIDVAPLGVALLIAPYNDPLAGLARKIAPAIAAGCPTMVKPSPLSWHVARVFESVMPYAYHAWIRFAFVATADGVARLIRHPGVGVVSFTGSTAVGREVAMAAASRPIPVVLELGGNCPFVVLENADAGRAAADFVDRKIRAAGQACSSITRVFVHESVRHAFLQAVEQEVSRRPCGLSTDPRTAYGPVRTSGLAARLTALADAEAASGARVVLRGEVVKSGEKGWFWPFTLAERSGPQGALDEEESFGPFAAMESFTDPAAVVDRLRVNRQRLVAYVYGPQPERFVARLGDIRFGSLGLNTTRIQGTQVPTGGYLDAGYGREGGRWGIEAFQTTVNTAIG